MNNTGKEVLSRSSCLSSKSLKEFGCLECYSPLVLSLHISDNMAGWPFLVPLWLAEGHMISAGQWDQHIELSLTVWDPPWLSFLLGQSVVMFYVVAALLARFQVTILSSPLLPPLPTCVGQVA